MVSRALKLTGALMIAAMAHSPAFAADPTPAPVAAPPTLKFPDNPREAGARYGQAAGVALVCYGMVTKPAVDDLKAHYTGEDLAAFNDQAQLIIDSWKELLTCKRATGPNECKLSQGKSCYEANREIGMNGTKLPGLIDGKPVQSGAAAAVTP
jgi:hypothetical protein